MLAHYALTGYFALTLAVLVGAVGLPLPLNMLLAAAGSLARQGHLSLSLLFCCSIVAAVTGDNAGYLVGRGVLRRMPVPRWLLRFTSKHRDLDRFLTTANFGVLVFVTRWAITAPASPVNLIAGARRFNWRLFLLIDICGESLWVAFSLLPGFVLGGQWVFGVTAALGLSVVAAVAVTLFSPGLGLRTLHRTAPATP